MRILIKYPTRQRYHTFVATIKNIQETIGHDDYNILISWDLDDEQMQTPAAKEIMSRYINFGGVSHNKIDAVNRDMIKGGKWDILVQVSDDMKFVKHGWGKVLEEKIKNDFNGSLDCYLHFNDGHVGQRLCTMQIMGREFFERTGCIYNPIYKTIYSDAESMFVAMLLGKHKYYDESIYVHQHPANGYQCNDGLYDRNNTGGDDDKRIYEKRRAKLFYVNSPATIPYELIPFWKR
jgi:hypothetical protein